MCYPGIVSTITDLDIAALKPPLNVTLISTIEQLQLVKDYLDKVEIFAIDLETNVVDTIWQRKIRTIQVGDKNEQFVIDLLSFAGSTEALISQGGFQTPEWAKEIYNILTPHLDSNTRLKIGVNLAFEYMCLRWCLGIYSWHFYDCMMAEKCLYAGEVNFFTEGFYSMDGMVQRRCNLKVDKQYQTSFNLTDPLSQDQINYAALDCRLPYAIKASQAGDIAKAKLTQAVLIENDAIPAFADMHLNGIFISKERWMKIVNETKAKHAANIKVLDKFFLPVVGGNAKPKVDLEGFEKLWREESDKGKRAEHRATFYKHRKKMADWEKSFESWEGQAAINYGSNPQLLDALRKMGFGVKKLKNTSDPVLKKLEAANPVIKALTNYRETGKILSTYGEGFIEKHVTEFCRVHSKINQYGAETGRTTSSNPNVQNIPKGSDWRACFVAPAGRKIITVDYNGCELRILAELSGEVVWIEAFNNGWDVHSVGAEILFGAAWSDAASAQCAYYKDGGHQKCDKKVCPVHAKLRDQIKAINFGIAYGMEAQRLADGLGIDKEAAQKLLDKYRLAFKMVTAYLKISGETAKMTLACRTMAGRRRLFKKPTWELAREKAVEKAKKEEREYRETDVSKLYYAMFGSIEREGKNTPIQGTNADIIKWAMGCGTFSDGTKGLWHQLRLYSAMLVNMVHDELVLESEESCAEEVYEVTGKCMKAAGADFVKSVVMEYEGHIADEWSK